MSRPSPASEATQRRRLPAWLLSLGLHGLLLLGLGLAMNRWTAGEPDEPARQVGIVLTEATGPRSEQYFRDPRPAADPEPFSETDSLEAATQRALPGGVEAEALLPDLQLPGSALPSAAPEGMLLPDLDLGGGRFQRPLLPSGGDEEILAEEAARRAAREALGPTTELSVFGSAPATGRSFVFAIDRSHSMGSQGLNALAAARVELARAVSRLEDNHRFQIVAYHHQCVYLTGPRLLPATPENRARVGPFIDSLAAFGGTGHEAALRVSLAMEPDAVFLLTDGGDPHLDEIELANLRKLAEGRTAIHSVQFGFGPASEASRFMRLLAEQNGGRYTYVDMSAGRGP